MNQSIGIEEVSIEGFDYAVDVHCDAFYDYPAMRFIIGNAAEDYSWRLGQLIGFFTRVRFLRGDLVLAAKTSEGLIGVANVVRPDTQAPEAVEVYRDALWANLGESSRRRYDAFGEATEPFVVPEPHYHLSMLGVRKDHAGQGVGRLLLDAVHAISRSDAESCGVSLTTETRSNVALYEHVGYKIVGEVDLGELISWSMFRPDPLETAPGD
jgi:ribosomal protein S18 acetylase RimI-like enzyme